MTRLILICLTFIFVNLLVMPIVTLGVPAFLARLFCFLLAYGILTVAELTPSQR